MLVQTTSETSFKMHRARLRNLSLRLNEDDTAVARLENDVIHEACHQHETTALLNLERLRSPRCWRQSSQSTRAIM